MFIEILFKMLLFKGGVLIYAEHCINTVQFLAQTDCFVSLDLNVSPRAAGFNLVLSMFFFYLKAVSTID